MAKLSKHGAAALAIRKLWATGLPRYSQLVIMRGRIRLIPHKDTGKIYTELWGSGVYLHIYWFCDVIPPEVVDGKMATVIGNIQTYNLNTHVAVSNCMHIPKGGPALGKEIRDMMKRYALNPQAYISQEYVDQVVERILAKNKK